jgi:hypothetical protein
MLQYTPFPLYPYVYFETHVYASNKRRTNNVSGQPILAATYPFKKMIGL